ncbi:MAG: ATPase, T2SS/T4P/T4SS family [Planctomycetota bacterium]
MPLTGFAVKVLTLLKERELIDQAAAAKVTELAEQAGDKKTIDEILIENGFIDEEMFIYTLSTTMRMPPINLDKVTSDPALKDDIPEDLVNFYHVFPLTRVGKVLTVAVANPADVISHDDFKVIVGLELHKTLSTVPAIKRAVQRLYHAEDKKVAEFLNEFKDESPDAVELRDRKAEETEEDLASRELGNDVTDVINKILLNAVRSKCTDIHFEPMEKHLRVRTRRDGVLSEMTTLPRQFSKNLATRIKVMTSQMDISERRMPQDGSFRVIIDQRHIDFRVSSLPIVYGEKIVTRILDKAILNYSLADLGFEENVLKTIDWAIHQPYGMILCNGPTGCGKTTTLYTCIKDLNNIAENLTTVEEPVEYEIYGINQVSVQVEQGRSFPAALRSILRQDPDTILIGEIRDPETIDIAVKAALTGHLVFSTLHTSDAASTITRILGLGVEPFLVGSSLLCIVSQRLARRLCIQCRQPMARPTPAALMHFGFEEAEAHDTSIEYFEAVGCAKCDNTGYRGRFAVSECLRVDEEMSKLITDSRPAYELSQAAIAKGMQPLRRSGINAIKHGISTFEEIKKVSGVE